MKQILVMMAAVVLVGCGRGANSEMAAIEQQIRDMNSQIIEKERQAAMADEGLDQTLLKIEAADIRSKRDGLIDLLEENGLTWEGPLY